MLFISVVYLGCSERVGHSLEHGRGIWGLLGGAEHQEDLMVNGSEVRTSTLLYSTLFFISIARTLYET